MAQPPVRHEAAAPEGKVGAAPWSSGGGSENRGSADSQAVAPSPSHGGRGAPCDPLMAQQAFKEQPSTQQSGDPARPRAALTRRKAGRNSCIRYRPTEHRFHRDLSSDPGQHPGAPGKPQEEAEHTAGQLRLQNPMAGLRPGPPWGSCVTCGKRLSPPGLQRPVSKRGILALRGSCRVARDAEKKRWTLRKPSAPPAVSPALQTRMES